jgi:uncharacterized protein YndB with AHSA1/START domain
MDFRTTVEIDAPPDIVWATLLDVDHWPEWTRSVRTVERLDGTTLESGGRVRIKQPGLPMLVWTVSEVEPGTSFTWRAASPGLTTVGTHRVEPVAGDRTAVTLGIHQSGLLSPILGRLITGRTKRYVQMEAEGLQHRAELLRSGSEPGPPGASG